MNQLNDYELARKVKLVGKLMTSHELNVLQADEATRIREKY